jgi:hypothetical protein
MKKAILLLSLLLSVLTISHAQTRNLLKSGDFQSLKHWTQNLNLSQKGEVKLLSDENGVMITNPVIDLDGTLYQDIPVSENQWYSWSVRIKGGGMMRASMGLMSIDNTGNVLRINTPTKLSGSGWKVYAGSYQVPRGAKTLRVMLSVLDGSCSFSDISITRGSEPIELAAQERFVAGRGVSVKAYSTSRPFWELHADDLDGDGLVEIIACDVDGKVTVRNPGLPEFFSYAAPALVYQFETADMDRDGRKEILLSLIDPKFNIKAINLDGETVCTFNGYSSHERMASADMDGDGYPEIATSKNNGVAGSGIAAGVVLYNHRGEVVWEAEGNLREFHFGDVHPEPGIELIVGGPAIDYRIYNKAGTLLQTISLAGGTMDHFVVADFDEDGKNELIGTFNAQRRTGIICSRGNQVIWESVSPNQLGGSPDAGVNISAGDYDPSLPGLELALIGTHSFFLFDKEGTLIYQNREPSTTPYWQSWADRGINSLEIAQWKEDDPRLFLSSSRFRHRAYYEVKYGGVDELSAYRVPDQEKHLEEIYTMVKQQPALPSESKEKIKVFMALGGFATASAETLAKYRKVLDEYETGNIEYMIMFEASDLYGHERGHKLTTDQIVERSRMFEEAGIPFGYFVAHGGQVWTSEEAIRRSKEVAPNTFRFLYIAENLETLYFPLYKDVLAWTDKMLDFCSGNGMKMIFKEKHDVWGLLPSDPEVSNILFSEKHKKVAIPIWSTNQPYQPEIQLGGMLGLKKEGFCEEFGMSTQYWNWHEWGRYPRGIRDVSPTFICPSDVILRLDLMGIALGATWIHIEGGQTYFESDISQGLAPLAVRHRDLAYELVRKNFLIPGSEPCNINSTAVVRHFHSELEKGKAAGKRVAYPYYDRNTEGLRKGFIPARYLFETYSQDAFPWIAYSMAWNSITCFPETPNGWITVLPPMLKLSPEVKTIVTDGEMVKIGEAWKSSAEVISEVADAIKEGTDGFLFDAPGTCMIVHKVNSTPGVYTLLLMDPGYLAPTGVETTVIIRNHAMLRVTDLVDGTYLESTEKSCPLSIQPGAFRLIKIELKP